MVTGVMGAPPIEIRRHSAGRLVIRRLRLQARAAVFRAIRTISAQTTIRSNWSARTARLPAWWSCSNRAASPANAACPASERKMLELPNRSKWTRSPPWVEVVEICAFRAKEDPASWLGVFGHQRQRLTSPPIESGSSRRSVPSRVSTSEMARRAITSATRSGSAVAARPAWISARSSSAISDR